MVIQWAVSVRSREAWTGVASTALQKVERPKGEEVSIELSVRRFKASGSLEPITESFTSIQPRAVIGILISRVMAERLPDLNEASSADL
jgi:hypothetical protein